jgi:glucan phosphoethanolaminetransferase (alkaline phosphatase superfamily)
VDTVRDIFDSLRRHSPSRQNFASLLRLSWLLLLILPAATTQSSSHVWDFNQHYLFAASCWLIVALHLLTPASLFFPLTFPIAVIGASCMAADFLRNVDLLELVLQWRTFSATDIESSMRPYLPVAIATMVGLALLCWTCHRWRLGQAVSRRKVALVVIGTAALVLAMPIAIWLRAWPMNALLVLASAIPDSPVLADHLFPVSSTINPRSPSARWNAVRATRTAEAESFVFVIGETIRSDYLRECGGPSLVRPVAPEALVACDVTSGSDATHTSVPLLISREMPGHAVRVSSDASFVQAFREVGFESHWYGVQGNTLAWGDAQYQDYPSADQGDSAALMPLLDRAMANSQPRKLVVLHAYNAHEPYCSRYQNATAPYAVECPGLQEVPSAASIEATKLAYANAVDASVHLVNQLIARLDAAPGEAFLLFTPDHGENLLDDKRQLYGHAMRRPTRWDTQVPVVIWANAAWRNAHPNEWAALAEHVKRPLMHADLVPTFLGAAGIRYEDARLRAINLLVSGEVPDRPRVVQTGLGMVTDWQTMVREAQ